MKEPKCPHVEIVARRKQNSIQYTGTWECKWCGCPFTPVVEPDDAGRPADD